MNTPEGKRAAYLAAPEIELVFGTPEALDDTDAVTVIQIIDYIRSRPALGKADKVALAAIAMIGETNAEVARALMSELAG
jgi:hypothetical protein